MPVHPLTSRFQAKLQCPAKLEDECLWTFLLLPKAVSDTLPRRGRTTVVGKINDHSFRATLEPDGQLGHWLKVGEELRETAGVAIGDTVTVELSPVEMEPDPELPIDLEEALNQAPEARRTWDRTTTLARVDWIHWIVSAKQSKTREKRIRDACDMLAAGKKRVCCFDPSGYYSKGLSAPTPAVQ
jgi:hypothetical protein